MNLKHFFHNQATSKIILILAVLLVILVIFQAGLTVGFRKASFACNWNDSFLQGPNNPRSMLAPFINDKDDFNPHGAIGQIISTSLPVIMIKGQDNLEKVIHIGPNTAIRNFRQTASTSDLTVGQNIIVVGEPDDSGNIQAVLIRIIPAPPNTRVAPFQAQ